MAQRTKYLLLCLFILTEVFSQSPNFDSVLNNIKKTEDKYNYCHKEIYTYENLNTQTALHLSKKKLEFAKILNDKRKIAGAYNDIGNQFLDLGNYSEALNNYIESSKFYGLMKDSAGIADEFSNISLIYSNKEDYPTAKHFLIKALRVYKNNNNSSGYCSTLMALADVCRDMNQIDSAFYCYNYVIKHSHDSLDLVVVYNNMGLYFSDINNVDSALYLYELSNKYNLGFRDKHNYAICLSNIADCYFKKGDMSKALKGYIEALKLSSELQSPELVQTNCDNLAIYYKRKKIFDSAYYFLERAKIITDSLDKHDNDLKLSDVKSGFDRDEKEAQLKITVLENEKKEREKKDIKIIFIISSILLLTIIGFAISRYKSKQKSYNKLKTLNDEVVLQKNLVEEKQKEIVDSITYAQRIQKPLLAREELIKKHFTDCFILFKPKAIVSGDFYWASEMNDKLYLAVCDSTGHGVPGAFMSLLNMGFLSEAVKEKSIIEPNEIFNYVRNRLVESISDEGQKDGFDGSLILYHKKYSKIYYSAAYCTPLVIRNDEIMEMNSDKMPVGKGERKESFTLHELDVQPNDRVYLYTDGFADQFGGPKGKKFKYKNLKKVLLSEYINKMSKQKDVIDEIFEEWRGELEQTDDVTIIGLKI
jgi:serine phosphatase RsbU (regulator of sigma subunit)/predicted negative regulator of RcsB-dependent stress response